MRYVLVGLGNPEERYENTRHNAGFQFVDSFGQLLHEKGYDVSAWSEEKLFNSLIAVCKGATDEFVLMKPLTYMNKSGMSVRKYIEKKEVELSELVIIHDDLDIELGQFKIQLAKSPKEHNGVISVENHLKTKEFLRVRIGVETRKDHTIPGEDYVLMRMNPEEAIKMQNGVNLAVQALFTQLTSQQG